MKRLFSQPIAIVVLSLVLAGAALAQTGPNSAAGVRRHNLYMVSVGETYTRGGQNYSKLPCCEKDAADMVRWGESQKGKLFDDVHARALVDGDAKAKDVLDALRGLTDKVKPGDYAIVYLSGHGGIGNDDRFTFCAYDRNIAWQEIQAALGEVRGTVIVVLDACHAGGVDCGGNLIILSASLRDKCSLAGADKDHNSLYTRFLLEALNGQADMNGDGFISLAEVDAYVSGKLALMKETPSTLVRPANVPSVLPLASLSKSPTVPAAPTVNLADTIFAGSEALGGYGKLTFKFLADGTAAMTDARTTVMGKYAVTGNQVVINFPGVANYSGTINGSILSGSGTDSTRTWSFTVTKQ